MNEIVLNHWINNEIIGIDCLLKEDGSVIIMKSYSVKQDAKEVYFSSPVCETSINGIEKFDNDIWTSIDIFTEKINIDNNTIVFGGEGGMGNEGFIACTDDANNLKWALFFTNSNPFYKIEFVKGKINAYTSTDLKYQIDIQNPEIIKISKVVWR
jgi:hypothetical protein